VISFLLLRVSIRRITANKKVFGCGGNRITVTWSGASLKAILVI